MISTLKNSRFLLWVCPLNANPDSHHSSKANMAMAFPHSTLSLLSIKTHSLWLWYMVHHICVSLTHVDLTCQGFTDSGTLWCLLYVFLWDKKNFLLSCFFFSSLGQRSSSDSHRLGEPLHYSATSHPTPPPPYLSFLQMFLSTAVLLHSCLQDTCYTHVVISGATLLMSSLFPLSSELSPRTNVGLLLLFLYYGSGALYGLLTCSHSLMSYS